MENLKISNQNADSVLGIKDVAYTDANVIEEEKHFLSLKLKKVKWKHTKEIEIMILKFLKINLLRRY